jgi:hypothetical protein
VSSQILSLALIPGASRGSPYSAVSAVALPRCFASNPLAAPDALLPSSPEKPPRPELLAREEAIVATTNATKEPPQPPLLPDPATATFPPRRPGWADLAHGELAQLSFHSPVYGTDVEEGAEKKGRTDVEEGTDSGRARLLPARPNAASLPRRGQGRLSDAGSLLRREQNRAARWAQRGDHSGSVTPCWARSPPLPSDNSDG